MRRNHICYDRLICAEDKAKACNENNIQLHFDDSISQCMAIKEAGIESILMTSKGNREKKVDLPRIVTPKQYYECVFQRTSDKPYKIEDQER